MEKTPIVLRPCRIGTVRSEAEGRPSPKGSVSPEKTVVRRESSGAIFHDPFSPFWSASHPQLSVGIATRLPSIVSITTTPSTAFSSGKYKSMLHASSQRAHRQPPRSACPLPFWVSTALRLRTSWLSAVFFFTALPFFVRLKALQCTTTVICQCFEGF